MDLSYQHPLLVEEFEPHLIFIVDRVPHQATFTENYFFSEHFSLMEFLEELFKEKLYYL